MQKIIPFLWFDGQAEEAASFYASVFDNAHVGSKFCFQSENVVSVTFELEGLTLTALNGGPHFKFTPAISFFVYCATVEEIHKLFDELSSSGDILMPLQKYPFAEMFGWTKDKYGLTWQFMLADGKHEHKIFPFLTFAGAQHGKAEEAMNFYTSMFEDSSIIKIDRTVSEAQPDLGGSVVHAVFKLNGQHFMALDSGGKHDFTFNEAVSFFVNCDSQEEVDNYWFKLSAVPEAERCGWLKDKYGVSWQIIPTQMGELLGKSHDAVNAMFQMKKIDLAALEKAAGGGPKDE